jgi:DNA-binding transcriptional LysR family regulator
MAFPRLFKQKVPTLEQMDGLIRFVDEGSLANAFGKGKGDQGKGTQKLGRIDRCFGIRTRMSSGGGKVPTPEAEELAGICRAFFQKLEDFKSRSERAPNSFVVGAGDTLTFYLLIPALKRAEAWRATAQLHLHNLRSSEIVSGLTSGALDVGLVRLSAVEKLVRQKRLKAERLCRLEYVFCVHRSALNGFAGSESDEAGLIKWCMKTRPLAAYYGETSTFSEALGKIGVDLPIQLCCESFPQVREAVTGGGYCGIIPALAARELPAKDFITFGTKTLAKTSRDVALVWSAALTERRKGGDDALGVLRTALKATINSPAATT